MRIGINFTPPHDSPEQWAEILAEKGYRAASFPVNHRAPVSLIDAYADAAAAHDICIAEVGVWNSPYLPDTQAAQQAQAYCLEQFRLAEYVRAKCCVNVSGAAGEKWFFCYPENFDQALYEKNVRFLQDLCDTVKPKHTVYALEPMPWMLPWDAAQYRQLLQDVGREGIGVHMDIFNFVRDPYLYTHQRELMDEAFRLLGDAIVSSHIKDIRMHVDVSFSVQETPIGTGESDLAYYLELLSRLSPDTPVLIEHLSELKEYDAALAYLKQHYAQYIC